MAKTMLPETASNPTPPLHVQQSYKHVTGYFATFLAFMVLSLNQARHFCHKEILTPSYHIKQGSSLAWLWDPQINKNINVLFCWEGCSHILTTHHLITISVIGNVTKKLGEIKLIF